MDDLRVERYTFAQISRATGVDVQTLEHRRRNKGLLWQPGGYTMAEICVMLGSVQTVPREEMDGCRSAKTKVLWAELVKRKERCAK